MEATDIKRAATLIPYTRSWAVLFTVLMALLIVLCAVATAVMAGLMSEGSYVYRAAVVVVLAPILAIVALPYLLGNFLRGRQRMGVGMTRYGFFHRSYIGCVSYRWEDVQRISAISRGPYVVHMAGGHEEVERHNQLDSEETWIAKFARYRKGLRHIPAGHLTVHPGLAYKTLLYYFEHPERRTELGTDAALERIQRADFSS